MKTKGPITQGEPILSRKKSRDTHPLGAIIPYLQDLSKIYDRKCNGDELDA
jgi:hypothetical protein